MFTAIVAVDLNKGIGKNNTIPWKCSADMKHFKNLTTGHVVIMGRKTFESMNCKPLKNRINCVIGTSKNKIDEVLYFDSPETCARHCMTNYKEQHLFVIGGNQIYTWFYNNNYISNTYLTELDSWYDCDVFFDSYDKVVSGAEISNENIEYEKDKHISIIHFKHVNLDESNFLNLGKEILLGNTKADRTGTGTISLFGKQLEFDLSGNTFPLLTSRKMSLRLIFEELMLYLRGQTDNNILVDKGVNIWTANTTREFLDKRGLDLPVGDMGPSYGFLFRHFGAKYINCKTDYKGQGTDQLQYVIDTIKKDPTNRRLIISLWDPTNIDKCPLPPCLYNYQFYITQDKLSCMMTQRSSDFAVAGGWNVATGALLTYLIASVTNLEPNKLIWNIGDVHIYKNLIDDFKEQVKREPYAFPKLYLNKKIDITNYEYEDLTLLGYKNHPAIKYQMSV
jgi:thymidylate synthase